MSTRDVTKESGAVFREEADREGIRSILNVPLTAGDRAIGIVRIYTADVHDFTGEEKERLTFARRIRRRSRGQGAPVRSDAYACVRRAIHQFHALARRGTADDHARTR